MAEQEKNSKPLDPFEPFRQMRDAYLDSMAKTMVETVNTEAYAQATGAMLEGYLSAAAPFREAMEKSMTQTLQQLSLPSRQELAALAERFTNVEMRLDDMDAKLDQILQAVRRERPAAAREEAPSPGVREHASPRPETAPSAAASSAAQHGGAHAGHPRKAQR